MLQFLLVFSSPEDAATIDFIAHSFSRVAAATPFHPRSQLRTGPGLQGFSPAGTVVFEQYAGEAIAPDASLAESRFWPSARNVVPLIVEAASIRRAMLRTSAAWFWLAGFLLFSAKTFGGVGSCSAAPATQY